MTKNKVKRNEWETKNDIRKTTLKNKYKNIALNIFKYEGLPEELPDNHIEKVLYEKGSIAVADTKNGRLWLPFTQSNHVNVYNQPSALVLTGHGFTQAINREKCAIIRNNPLNIPTQHEVDFWVDNIVDVLGAFSVNLNHSKTPYIITGTKEQLLSIKNMLNEITGNALAVIIDSSMQGVLSAEVKPTSIQYIGDKLLDAYDRLEDKLLTYLGINNTNTTKRERLVVDEVNSNNDEIENNLDVFLTARKEGVKKINEMFGYNIEVSVNQVYVKEQKDKVEDSTLKEGVDNE